MSKFGPLPIDLPFLNEWDATNLGENKCQIKILINSMGMWRDSSIQPRPNLDCKIVKEALARLHGSIWPQMTECGGWNNCLYILSNSCAICTHMSKVIETQHTFIVAPSSSLGAAATCWLRFLHNWRMYLRRNAPKETNLWRLESISMLTNEKLTRIRNMKIFLKMKYEIVPRANNSWRKCW